MTADLSKDIRRVKFISLGVAVVFQSLDELEILIAAQAKDL
jgi:hypothetical protein